MSDEEYNKKLQSLQQYIPFLNNMITQLKDPRKKNREQQLQKMVSLHSMITDKKKKLKLDTLIKCEDVILKLYDKVKSGSQPLGKPELTTPIVPESPMSPITPSSPSPPKDIPMSRPVVIPTEKVPNKVSTPMPSRTGTSNVQKRIDIYSTAADSLRAAALPRRTVFERLGYYVKPDMSKPPISLADLEALQSENNPSPPSSFDAENMSLGELTNLRARLQKQLLKATDSLAKKPPVPVINTTVRNTTILTKRAVDKSPIRAPESPTKPSASDLARIEKFVGELQPKATDADVEKPQTDISCSKIEVVKSRFESRADNRGKSTNKDKSGNSPDQNLSNLKVVPIILKIDDTTAKAKTASLAKPIIDVTNLKIPETPKTDVIAKTEPEIKPKSEVANLKTDVITKTPLDKTAPEIKPKSDVSKPKTDVITKTSLAKTGPQIKPKSDVVKPTTDVITKTSLTETGPEVKPKSDVVKPTTDVTAETSLAKTGSEIKPKSDVVKPTTDVTAKTPLDKAVSGIKPKLDVPKPKTDVSTKSPAAKPKVEKVLKEPDSIFGSMLSNIDSQILGGSKHKDKKESIKDKQVYDKHERRPSKDEKKSELSRHKSKERTERRSSSASSSSDSKVKDGKDKKKSKTDGDHSKKDHKDKDRVKTDKTTKTEDKHAIEELISLPEKPPAKPDEDDKQAMVAAEPKEPKPAEDKPKVIERAPQSADSKVLELPQPADKPPVYKRLADKYNPKPRKPSIDALEMAKPAQTTSPVKIPFLDIAQAADNPPLKLLPLSSPLLPTPTIHTHQLLLSPSTSINSIESELGPSRKLDFNSAQVSNILANPTTNAILNSVISQFKANQAILPADNRVVKNFPNSFPAVNIPQQQQQFGGFVPQSNFQQQQQQQPVMQQQPNIQLNMQQNIHYTPPNLGNTHNYQMQQQQSFHNSGPDNIGNTVGQRGRPFTPFNPLEEQQTAVSNQYDQMMYQNRAPTPFMNSGGQFDHNDRSRIGDRCPSRLSTDSLFGNQDKDMRQYSMPPRSRDPREMAREAREQSRDPREQSRDPREQSRDFRDRDPRYYRAQRGYRDSYSYRDDHSSRSGGYRESRDYYDRDRDYDKRDHDRESRPHYRDSRDPRLERRDRYDRDYSRNRSRSRSRSRARPGEDFGSPLDSLYTGSDGQTKTGKGYGVQSFRIPKMKKEGDEVEAGKPDDKAEEQTTNEASTVDCAESKSDDQIDHAVNKVVNKAQADANVSSSSEPKIDAAPAPTIRDSCSSEISSTNNEPDAPDEGKTGAETDIINQFLKTLLQNDRTRAAASMFINELSESANDERLKAIMQTVKSLGSADDQPKEAEEDKEEAEPVTENLVTSPPKKQRKKPRRRKRKKALATATVPAEDPQPPEETEPSEEIVVSVGERIKSRRRLATLGGPQKPKVKHKTELDLLHEDIHDMFIRDGVLTATGKRMCCLLKNDPTVLTKTSKEPEPSAVKTRRSKAEKFDASSTVNSDKFKAMSNVRVLIPKISVRRVDSTAPDGTEDESKRYSLRSVRTGKSYAENDSDEDRDLRKRKRDERKAAAEQEQEEEDLEELDDDADSDQAEPEPIEPDSVAVAPVSAKRSRKRVKAWASGIILKTKRKTSKSVEITAEDIVRDIPDEDDTPAKTTPRPVTPPKQPKTKYQKRIEEHSPEFVEPDRSYFVTGRLKIDCKLCTFNGVNIANHYKHEHPDSEVLSSRLSPQSAEEAIRDSVENNPNQVRDTKSLRGQKYLFRCRFCDRSIKSNISYFYDHISVHTGEYRHKCDLCPYASSHPRGIKIHYQNEHKTTKNYKAPMVLSKIYGYLCTECNFVQMDRKTVQNHVNIYHLGEGEKMRLIHMSWDFVEAAADGAGDMSAAAELSTAEVSAPEVSAAEVSAAEVSASEVSASEVSASEVSAGEVSASDMSSADISVVPDVPADISADISADTSSPDKDKGSDASKRSLEDESSVSDEPPRKKQATEDQLKIKSPPKVKKEKEIDMTVFTCNTDIHKEEEQIEQERLKKMTELNECVKTNRQSLNFVDELSNRLRENCSNLTAPKVPIIKTEPVSNDDEEMPQSEPDPVPVYDKISEMAPKKLKMADATTVEVVPKLNNMISNMIQKLRGILTEDEIAMQEAADIRPTVPSPVDRGPLLLIDKPSKTSSPLPPPIVKVKEEVIKSTLAGIKVMHVTKDSDLLTYSCKLAPCGLVTDDRNKFVDHWDLSHSDFSQTVKDIKCQLCDSLFTKLLPFLTHLEQHQSNKISSGPPPLMPLTVRPKETQTILAAGFLNIVKDEDRLEYVCKVPSCVFSTSERDKFLQHWDEDHPRFQQSFKGTKCILCHYEISASEDAPLLRNFFDHVEINHSVSISPFPSATLRTRRLSGDKLSKSLESLECKEDEIQTVEVIHDENEVFFEPDDNPFPFKISGVMSLAEDSIPPLSPLSDKSKAVHPASSNITSILLKESKLTDQESQVAWKSQETYAKFMAASGDLYKCPSFFCSFHTNKRNVFKAHVATHKNGDELVACVYCDFKTPLSQAPIHIYVRHSKCKYSCSQCLYRASLREYVMAHLYMKHPESDQVVLLSTKSPKNLVMAVPKKASISKSCPPYICGEKDCDVKFFFQNDFVDHMQNAHQGIYVCAHKNTKSKCLYRCIVSDSMIDHWRSHHCYSYHCLYCKMGCSTLYSMLEHYATSHQYLFPNVADRTKNPGFKTKDYDSVLEHILPVGKPIVDSVRFLTKRVDRKIAESPNKPANVVNIVQTQSKKFFAIKFQTVDATAAPATTTVPSLAPLITVATPNIDTSTPSEDFVFAAAGQETKDSDVVMPGEGESPTPGEDNEEPMIVDVDKGNDEAASDPLSLDVDLGPSSSGVGASGEDSDSQDVHEAGGVTKNFGLIGYQLYRCAICESSFSNSRNFKMHLIHTKRCLDRTNPRKPYKCPHCHKAFKHPSGLLEHVQYHGQLRFSCSLCVKKFPSTFSSKLHMRWRHNVQNTIITPLVLSKSNVDQDEFILRPRPIETEITKETNQKDIELEQKTEFSPAELNMLPQRHIFNFMVKCALCPYSTKVRTNLVRHLQFHSSEKSVPASAPVNPVPCLDKNEKMFDKMTNLAISSFAGAGRMGGGPKPEQKVVENVEFPAYVPLHRRYACSASGCSYLCPEESNLRHHLFALHENEPQFTCVHCTRDLKTDVDGFLKHLKLHDLHLYKCNSCKFIHNLKHKVERHSADKHPESSNNVTTIRALEAEISEGDPSPSQLPLAIASTSTAPTADTNQTEPNQSALIKWAKPWHCGVCKYRCSAKSDIIIHTFNKHDINSQFKCALCSYKSDEKSTFEPHFKEYHPDHETDIIFVYYKSEHSSKPGAAEQKSFDTTPLWQRDRPRVRHIRGILLEETNVPKIFSKKTPMKTVPVTCTATSNLDLAIDAVAKGIDGITRGISDDTFKMLNDQIKSVEVIKPVSDQIKQEDQKDQNEKKEEQASAVAESETNVDPSIIVIDDEDEEEESFVALSSFEAKESEELPDSGDHSEYDNLYIDIEGDDPLAQQIALEPEGVTQDIEPLTEEKLEKKYFRLVSPATKAYRCPLCTKYKTRKISNFVYHILKEMGRTRFKCKWCDFTAITFFAISVHCHEVHGEISSSTTSVETPLEDTLELWLHLLVRFQSGILAQEQPPLSISDVEDSGHKSKCKYCNKWLKNIYTLKDHEMYHWAHDSYMCNHCQGNFASMNEIFHHTSFDHPGRRYSLKYNGPSMTQVISKLKDPPANHLSTIHKQIAQPAIDNPHFVCFYCMETKSSLEQLRKHWRQNHESENPIFRYTSGAESATRSKPLVFHCCTYCHKKCTMPMLKKHHAESHPDLKFSTYQLICLECSGTFSTVKELRAHFSKAHVGKKLSYSAIENKLESGCDVYSCPKCPFRSTTTGGIRIHIRKHLKPMECKICGATFLYRTDARHHHIKEHMHTQESIEENREKMHECRRIVAQIMGVKEEAIDQDQEEAAAGVTLDDGDAAPPTGDNHNATAPVKQKMVARKSTGARLVQVDPSEYYSYYGCGTPKEDLKSITTTIEVNKVNTSISVEQFSNIFNIAPVVTVVDCAKPPELS